jgi:heavy metal sensor kinase
MRLPSFLSTLRFRITLLNVLIFGITFFAFSFLLYFVHARSVAADFDRLLYNRALGIAQSISIDSLGQLEINEALIAESGRLLPFQIGNEYIELRSPDGHSLAHSKNLRQHELPLDSNLINILKQGNYAFLTVSSNSGSPSFWGEGKLRLLSMPLAAQGRIQVLVQLGVSTFSLDRSLEGLRTTIFYIGLPFALLLASVGGWWLAERAFRPINQIISATQQLSAQRLDARLPVPEVDDELKRLSLTLNEMLDRLQKAFNSQERFVADASHELKTPLTILQGELEVLRQQPRSPAEYEEFLSSASEELQQLTQIVQNLLLLARADSGRPLAMKEDVSLDEVLLSVLERLQSFAGKSQVKLSLKIDEVENPSDEKWSYVRGDPDLLASLFFNLIHNAIKYSTSGQMVEIKVQKKDSGPIVSVSDYGAGIREDDVPRIFERFHRAENPTRRDVAGTGLGLAIARWIAETHKANISVVSKPAEGSTFTVAFKKR